MLKATQVSKTYPGGVQALADVSLHVGRSETVALIGESGSGKTTLLRCFNLLTEPDSGSVEIEGESILGRNPVKLRRHLGYVPQDGGLMPHWTVERNVQLVPTLQGWEPDRVSAQTKQMLELVGLSPDTFSSRYPSELSGGQRQRVAIARALAADPEVVLLDEPFGALDAITRHELQEEFVDLKNRLGKTTLLVTHDLVEAFRLADRVGVMHSGRLLQVARPQDLVTDPADAYVAELLERGGITG
jgi:osmoprotectant transport system ATP-binding protein